MAGTGVPLRPERVFHFAGIRTLKQRYPNVRIVVRGDSGFAMPRLMRMLEELNEQWGDVDYLLGLARN
ncbi:transposase, partial [Archangium sp.]|uniref:transposase n=1 Tax=Archangium sp. TaxID=1872627 RepID=UPI0039C88D14